MNIERAKQLTSEGHTFNERLITHTHERALRGEVTMQLAMYLLTHSRFSSFRGARATATRKYNEALIADPTTATLADIPYLRKKNVPVALTEVRTWHGKSPYVQLQLQVGVPSKSGTLMWRAAEKLDKHTADALILRRKRRAICAKHNLEFTSQRCGTVPPHFL